MNTPFGRLEELQYREATFYTDSGHVGSTNVLRVRFTAPDGNVYHHDLPNGEWTVDNDALQFMAKWGYRPSVFEGWGPHDCHDDQVLLPLAPRGEEYGLSQSAMSDARAALESAEWFDPDLGGSDGGGAPDAAGGGSGPDPGTGNRGGVDLEMADEEDDSGVEIIVS